MGTTKKEVRVPEARESCKENLVISAAAELRSGALKTMRAMASTAPAHIARTTKVYSVSLPFWAVWSQRSNISTMGQTRQISKITKAATVKTRERTDGV